MPSTCRSACRRHYWSALFLLWLPRRLVTILVTGRRLTGHELVMTAMQAPAAGRGTDARQTGGPAMPSRRGTGRGTSVGFPGDSTAAAGGGRGVDAAPCSARRRIGHPRAHAV